jgi:hypothetical protein
VIAVTQKNFNFRYRGPRMALGRLLGAVAAGLLLPCLLAGEGNAADFRLRWRPSSSTGVTSYNVYVRAVGSSYGAPRDAGLPVVAGDGSMLYVVTGLQAGIGHLFAVAAVRTGVQSALSNELGVCGASQDCDDGNPCTADACDAGVCSHPADNEGVSCDDGDICNGTETCGGGVCESDAPLNCNDNNPCTTDGCQAPNGCTHALISGCQACTTNGTCSDGNPCNGTETCQAGSCRIGTALSCNDGNACTTDSCNVQTGCVNTPAAGCQACTANAQCDDGNACDGIEVCLFGRCREGTFSSCDDADPCTMDGCAPATGCTHDVQETCAACELRTQATLLAKRVSIKKSGYGIHFRATGVLEPALTPDPLRTGVVFDIRQPTTGEIFYRAIVPGSALTRSAAGNTVRLAAGTEVPTAPGLKFLRLRTLSTGRIVVAVFGRSQKAPSAFPVNLGWNVMLGEQCGSDSCTAYARTSDCN